MRVTAIEPMVCEAGWGGRSIGERGGMGRHSWVFVKVTTDEGVTGWGEAYDWQAGPALAEAIRIVADEVIGEDPREIERMNQVLWGAGKGGVQERQKVIAALDIAFWDIKGKWLGVPVYELLGGLYRRRIPLYWSHFASYRRWFAERYDQSPAMTLDSWLDLSDEVLARGYTHLKTNLLLPGDGAPPGERGGMISTQELDAAVTYIGALRDRLGPGFGIALDVGHSYRLGGNVRLAQALEPFDLYWLEVESYDHDAIHELRRQTRTRICTGESLVRREQFLPLLRRHATDVVMVETLANGLSEARRIAELAALFDTTFSPHNYMSPFATAVNAQLCAALPNAEILEIDPDDVAWKHDLIDHPLVIEDGALVVPDRPGIGVDINEDVVRAHPFQGAEVRIS